MEKEIELLSPKLDVVFQALFGEEGSERITKAFLEKILDIKIEEIELNQNLILRRQEKEGKLGVLDVLAKIDGKNNVDIEMQMEDKENLIDRMVYYWSRLYARSIKKKENYNTLEKCIVILISNECVKGFEELECHTEWRIYDNKYRKKILTDKFELHIIELEKLKNNMNSVSCELLDWLIFLQNPKSKMGVKSMDEDEEMQKSREENLKAIEEAREKLRKLSEDPKLQQLAWWREKGIYEENERKEMDAKRKEMDKKIENGLKTLEEGNKKLEEENKKLEEENKKLEEENKKLEEGNKKLEEGNKKLEEDRKKLEKDKLKLEEQSKEMARKLLELQIPIEKIIETTGLSEEEIGNL